MIWEPAYPWFARGYHRLLSWSLRHRPLVILVAILVFASNFLILPLLGTEFVPETNSTTATVVGELPPAPPSTPRTAPRCAGSRCCSTRNGSPRSRPSTPRSVAPKPIRTPA